MRSITVFALLVIPAIVLAFPLGFSPSVEKSIPYRPWEESTPRFRDNVVGGVHDWFVDSLGLIGNKAQSLLQTLHSIDENDLENSYSIPTTGENDFPPLPDRFFSFIPNFLVSAIPGAGKVAWNSSCFSSSSVVAEDKGDEGVELTFSTDGAKSKLCADYYLLLTTEGVHFHRAFFHGEHKITWKWSKHTTAAEKRWVANNGIRVFRFSAPPPSLLLDLLSTLELFSPLLPLSPHVNEVAARANIKFLQDYANVTMEPRQTQNVDLDESEINDGDFIAIIRLDGLDTMQSYGTGAHTGHTAMFLRLKDKKKTIENEKNNEENDDEYKLYVVESTDKTNYWPTPNIQRTEYRTWMAQARRADFHVRHIPLSPEARSKFDVQKAREFFESVEGAPYGYHNFIWGWVDTADDNFPYPLTRELIEPALAIVAKIEPAIGNKMWNMAFNKRLGTDFNATDAVYDFIQTKNVTFGQLISMPEQDSWRYVDGPSMVCDVLVCEVYKAGNLFGDLTNDIQCTEFQNWDVETLDFFDRNYTRPQKCIDADPNLPTCQLAGKYRLHVPNYGTIHPYKHMRENCGAEPPFFARKDGC